MEIFFAFIFGLGLYYFMRVVERYFTRYYFNYADIVTGKFSLLNLALATLSPFVISLIFGLIVKVDFLIVYAIPGFATSFLTVWPIMARPELIPAEFQDKKQSVITTYILFIISFTSFSYIGGLVGKSLIYPNILPSRQGLIDNIWAVLILGFISLIIRWIKK